MTPVPPPVDRRAASAAAVAARRGRATVKRAIAEGKRSAVEVLDESTKDPKSPEHTLRITEFLLSIPAIGETKMRRILDELGISDVKRLGGLGKHQRDRLRAFLLKRFGNATQPQLVVLSGPTAVGKGTVVSELRKRYPDIQLSISATTRAPRPGERDGVDYFFVSPDQFDRLIEENALLEYATVHGEHRYGTPASWIDEQLSAGRSVLLEIDMQGALLVRSRRPHARLVFLAPPSWDELVTRLEGRGTETDAERARRLETAKEELAFKDNFDDIIVNNTVAEAATELAHIMGHK